MYSPYLFSVVSVLSIGRPFVNNFEEEHLKDRIFKNINKDHFQKIIYHSFNSLSYQSTLII